MYTVHEFDRFRTYAIRFFPEDLAFSNKVIDIDTRNIAMRDLKVTNDGSHVLLYQDSKLEDKPVTKGLSFLMLDDRLREMGYMNLPDASIYRTYWNFQVSNEGIVYSYETPYTNDHDAYERGQADFYYAITALDLTTSESRTYTIGLKGFSVDQSSFQMSLSPDGQLDVRFGCQHVTTSNGAVAFIRLDPNQTKYQLSDYAIDIPLSVLNAGKNPHSRFTVKKKRHFQLIKFDQDESVLYMPDKTCYIYTEEAYPTIRDAYAGSPLYSSSTGRYSIDGDGTAAHEYHYKGIYLLHLDPAGRLLSLAKLPVRQKGEELPVKLMEVDGKLKVLYFDLMINLDKTEVQDFIRYNPSFGKQGQSVLVSATIAGDSVIRRQPIVKSSELPFLMWLYDLDQVYDVLHAPSPNFIVHSERYRLYHMSYLPCDKCPYVLYNVRTKD